MEAISQIIASTNVTEIVRLVWMEIAMVSMAATVYFTLTGWVLVSKKSFADQPQKSRKPLSPLGRTGDQEPTVHQQVIKALRQGKTKSALALLQELPEVLAGSVPTNIAPRLLMAVAKSQEYQHLMVEMHSLAEKIETRSFDAVVSEAAKNKDVAAGRQLLKMSRELSMTKSHHALEVLAKLLASDAECLQSLLEDSSAPLARPFAKAILEACTALKDIDLAAEVFEKVADSDAAMLRTIVERAASNHRGASTSADVKSTKQGSQVSQDIKACGKNGDLEGAIRLFSEQAEMAATGVMYNSIMDACVECGKLDMAMDYFSQARVKGLADIVSYNTAMKGCVSHGKVDAANRLFAELSEKGLAPTLASYHILVNFHVTAGDRVSAWNLFEAMQSAGIRPTPTTCSILLKGKALSVSDMDKVLEIIDTMPLDEVLFHSLAEACVRTGKLHVLAQYRAKLASQDKSPALTAPTYGSMIKAYGQAHDVEHVWSLWEDMTGHGIKPTAITLGCMVEALVANWCTVDAWKLVQEIRGDQSTRDLVNTVVYSSILKGFAYAKETHQVMALYEEMKAEGIEANTITFNTILNAFAQGGAMDRVPALLEDMKASTPPVEPDIVTYSTIVKGYCNSGSLDRALAIVKDMQSDGKLIPDEVMYNSILDGCAKEHRPTEALNILAQMKEVGVSPSNFTLSILVKLMGRCRRLNQAFSIIEDARRDYGLKWNIQVYTCLIQACFNNRQASKAVALHDQMIEEGVVPDEMAYSALVKGCLQASLIDKAIHLARCAHGLAHPKVRGIPPGINARTLDELSNALDPRSSEAKALLAELASCQVMSSKGGAKGKGKGKGSCKGGDATQARRQS